MQRKQRLLIPFRYKFRQFALVQPSRGLRFLTDLQLIALKENHQMISCSVLLSYVFQHGSADTTIIKDKEAKIKEAVRRGGERDKVMWIPKKKFKELEKRVSDLEKQGQGRTGRSETLTQKSKFNLHDTFRQECLNLAMKYHCSLEIAIDNYDILVQQDRCGGF